MLFNIKTYVSGLVKTNRKFAIVTTKKYPRSVQIDKKKYLDYSSHIERTFDNLTTQICNDIVECSYDYPDEHVCLLVTSVEGYESIHPIYGPEKI